MTMMEKALLLTLLLASVDCATKMKNIGLMAFGYDIYKGDPLVGLQDPGLSDLEIFSVTYQKNIISPDEQWIFPDSISIKPIEGCQQSMDMETITGEQSFQKTISNTVDVSAGASYGGFGAEFSTSTTFKETSKNVYTNNEIVFVMSANCNVYKATNKVTSPLTSEFVNTINRLPTTGNVDIFYHSAFDAFGTHYIRSSIFGSSLDVKTTVTEESYTNMISKNLSIRVGAEASFGSLFKLKVSNTNSEDTESINTFKKSIQKQTTTTKGSMPPADGNWVTWATNSRSSNPYQISFTLNSLSDLLIPENFGVTPDSAAAAALVQKQKLMFNAASTYCTSYLKNRKCRQAQVDKPLPKPLVRIRLDGVWGDWSSESICPNKGFVIGFQTQNEPSQGRGDDTAMNAIKFKCSDNNIVGFNGVWGSWNGFTNCKDGYTQAQIKVESPQGGGDDTAMNGIKLFCPTTNSWHEGSSNGWGGWSDISFCPSGTRIIGASIKVERPQGSGDDTAMNGIQIVCN